MMATRAPVAVIGATGRVGRLAVKELVEQGYPVRILLRSSSTAGNAVVSSLTAMPGVEAVQGDVNDAASVRLLLQSCSACLAVHGAGRRRQLRDLWSDAEADPTHSRNINYEGVRTIIEAAQASGTCGRVVRITGKGEAPWSIFSILINGLGSMAKAWNYEGENLLRACPDIDYTIIRPGVMGGEAGDTPPASLALADNGGDLKVSRITHGAIASLCVQCLSYPNAARCTLTAMSVPQGEGASSWAPLLAAVKPDRRAFRTDLLQEHRRAVALGGAALVVAASAVAAATGAAVRLLVLALVGLFTP
eukprot:CAMPEP_0119087440 /NCGR_PEP_ID=MMETSP1178-20130426/141694_1 /TAXON_ID=33656 /ORGANISM="unid sp, Strain CCMP2000" /LENGTH=305 /DNA_ID=CAMNT_0007070649 /DNA_START=85 /DNA_END=1002 /DNA_ORIENTATION=-